MMESEYQRYLRRIHAFLSFTNCAGEHAKVRLLHRNRLATFAGLKTQVLSHLDKVTDDSDHDFSNLDLSNNSEGQRKRLRKIIKDLDDDDPGQSMKTLTEIRNELIRVDKELHKELCINLNLEEKLFSTTNDLNDYSSRIRVIFGDPGYGKTVQLIQLAENFVHEVRKNQHDSIIPFFCKAKDIVSAVKEHPDLDRGDAYSVVSILIRNLMDHDVDLDELAAEGEGRRIVAFIDAWDECDSADFELLEVFMINLWLRNADVVLTSRHSHTESIMEIGSFLGTEIPYLDEFYFVDFTPGELRKQMPTKLLNAWGLDDHFTSNEIKLKFSAYEKVLTHPVFVGIFCLMVQRGEEVVDPMQLDDGKMLKFRSEITSLHVRFIDRVTKLGIELALERYKIKDTERYHDIFKAVAWTYHVTNEKNLNSIVEIMSLLGIIEIDRKELEPIKHGMGLLYSTDGESIEWVHKTLYEVGAAQFVHQHPNRLHRQLISSDCFLLALIREISDNEEVTLTKNPITRLARYFSSEDISIIQAFLEYHPAWKKPLFNDITPSTKKRANMVKLHKRGDLDAGQSDLANFLIELSKEGAKIPTFPTQYKDCLTAFFNHSEHFHLQLRLGELMGFIQVTHKRKGAKEFFAKHLLQDGDLKVHLGYVHLMEESMLTYLLDNIDRWTLLRWYSSEYPRLVRVNRLYAFEGWAEDMRKQYEQNVEFVGDLLEPMFEDILTKMKNKIENEYDILLDDIPHEIDKIWTGQPTSSIFDKFMIIYRLRDTGDYYEALLDDPTMDQLLDLLE